MQAKRISSNPVENLGLLGTPKLQLGYHQTHDNLEMRQTPRPWKGGMKNHHHCQENGYRGETQMWLQKQNQPH